MIPKITRWTPLVFLFPKRYVIEHEQLELTDIRNWALRYFKWRQDPYSGWMDIAKEPIQTYRDGKGDCEDYSLVIASWALTVGKPEVGLAFCWKKGAITPSHVIAYTDEMVYSTCKVGIMRGDTDDYLAKSDYEWLVKRPIKT